MHFFLAAANYGLGPGASDVALGIAHVRRSQYMRCAWPLIATVRIPSQSVLLGLTKIKGSTFVSASEAVLR